ELSAVEFEEIKVVNPDGIEVNVTGATLAKGPEGNNTAVEIQTSGELVEGDYKVTFNKDAVKDATKDKNGNDQTTTSAEYSIDDKFFTLDEGAVSVNPEDGTIDIDFGSEVNDAAAELSNYKIDNEAIPTSGTDITFVVDKQ